MRSLVTGARVTDVADVPCVSDESRTRPVTLRLPVSAADQVAFRRGAAYDRLHGRIVIPLVYTVMAAATALWMLIRLSGRHDHLKLAAFLLAGACLLVAVSTGVMRPIVISRAHPRIRRNGDVVFPRMPADLADEWRDANPGITVRTR
ncbi:hypothetical protein [Catenuloplanes atrovinosus]|uniref:Uncharacterized protein n=1 Tax=Catenuloplanes atrovinosus TaxID=137266 RepID=A0AAE4C8S5_9ACTN|nr:hypothetical protein [Catenuloplanes atrovinosus]MDR7275293.1 hypothetical protein [Catenuloplanes atrovinosus]